MPFRGTIEVRGELRRAGAGRVDDDLGVERFTVAKTRAVRAERNHLGAFTQGRAGRARAAKQFERRARRIDDGISRHAKRAGEPGAQIRLGVGELPRVEDFGVDSRRRVRFALGA
jgi:hypothetical protein